MRATIRVPGALLRTIREDLGRPHVFAGERVGFLFARFARDSEGVILLAFDYEAVADANYIEDDSVAARINSTAIRMALGRALKSGDCVVHVHAHEHSGVPRLGHVDMDGLRELMPSFCVVAPTAAHAGMVLSNDAAAARVWLPGVREPLQARVTFVGPGLTVCGVEP